MSRNCSEKDDQNGLKEDFLLGHCGASDWPHRKHVLFKKKE